MAQTSTQGSGFRSHAPEMLASHPASSKSDQSALLACVEACFDCAQACIACADACLGEGEVVNLVRCIRLDQDCADICDATGRILSRQTSRDASLTRALLEACAVACRACGDECDRHATRMTHCRVCAEACRACERACRALAGKVSA